MTIGEGPSGQAGTPRPNPCSGCVRREDGRDFAHIKTLPYQGQKMGPNDLMATLAAIPFRKPIHDATRGALCENCAINERRDNERRQQMRYDDAAKGGGRAR